jgi:hypothetical protein
MKSFLLVIVSIFIFEMCSSPKNNSKDKEHISISIEGLQKAYLDTSGKGVYLKFQICDNRLEERDSIQYFLAELDADFEPVVGYEGIYMTQISDTCLTKKINLPFNHLKLPVGVLYEVGAVYMGRPEDSNKKDWPIDTVINDYFAFRVYGDPEDYRLFVDSFGLDPVVFVEAKKNNGK